MQSVSINRSINIIDINAFNSQLQFQIQSTIDGQPNGLHTINLNEGNYTRLNVINLFTDIIKRSKTVFWNGTVGVAENKDFAIGTNKIIDAILNSECTSIVGGGDTIAAIRNYKKGIIEEFSHASTGGGSCLELLSGNKLSAIQALEK